MSKWVGIFVSNVDGKTIRELEVEADTEEDAIVMLDFYNYDDTWQNYSFVDIRKKNWGIMALLLGVLKRMRSHFFSPQINQAYPISKGLVHSKIFNVSKNFK